MTATVKELMKSVYVCHSYPKNRSGTVFYGPQCVLFKVIAVMLDQIFSFCYISKYTSSRCSA